MSAEYDAAIEVCGALKSCEESLDLIGRLPNLVERYAGLAMAALIIREGLGTIPGTGLPMPDEIAAKAHKIANAMCK